MFLFKKPIFSLFVVEYRINKADFNAHPIHAQPSLLNFFLNSDLVTDFYDPIEDKIC